jgi:transposase InsO family protein
LNALYEAVGTTKQGFLQKLDREFERRNRSAALLPIIVDIRKDHPTMGCRDMYYLLEPMGIGRDAFERFCREEGLMSKRIKNFAKTTDSSNTHRFPNRLEGLEITDINQVWVSDITYYRVKERFYYITFIMDAYSRRIVGHSVSKRLFTEQTTIVSLKRAIKTRGGCIPKGIIIHSDGGGQYYSDEFKALTNDLGMINSMCMYPWENGQAERINGVIKNNYLKHREINDFEGLTKEVDRSVSLYNNEKPHIQLHRLSPVQFEKLYFYSSEKSEGVPNSDGNLTLQTKGNTALRPVAKSPQMQPKRSRIEKVKSLK